jgi:transposase InsO family protein
VIVDGKSRYTWCRLLTTKSAAATTAALKEFIAEVGPMREILTDWGTEFAGSFRALCVDKGIRMKKSCPYVSWQNGLVEQRNRRLKTTSRKLLIHAGLGPEFWGHSIMTACYLQNRMASKHCNGLSPYEVMFRLKPNVSHLRVFGSVAYMLWHLAFGRGSFWTDYPILTLVVLGGRKVFLDSFWTRCASWRGRHSTV